MRFRSLLALVLLLLPASLGAQMRSQSRGFTTVLVSEPTHPFWEHWWPPGHIIGWGDTFVNELWHFLRAVKGETDVAPMGATFEDGYRAAEVCDAIVRSGESGNREQISYRSL